MSNGSRPYGSGRSGRGSPRSSARAHHDAQGEPGHLLEDREHPWRKWVGHGHRHPVLFPGDWNDPVLASECFGKQLGEIEGNGVGLDLEKRNPERLREHPSARIGVEPVRKEGGLCQWDPESRGTLRISFRSSGET